MKFDYPTILTNECAAGRIYEQLGMAYISPMINTNLTYDHFIKLCQEPRRYLVPITTDLYLGHWYRSPEATEHGYVPTAKIDDIEIVFAHDDNLEIPKARWNFLVQHLNFDRLVYVLVNSNGAIPYRVMRSFANLYGEKLMFYYKEMFNFPVASNIPFANRERLVVSADAVENYFDLVGWMNREYI